MVSHFRKSNSHLVIHTHNVRRFEQLAVYKMYNGSISLIFILHLGF